VAGADEDPFALLADPGAPAPDAPAGFVGGGWFGYLGFGLGAGGERIVSPPPTRERLPRFALAFYDHLLRRDAAGQWWFEALWSENREVALDQRLDTLRERLAGAGAAPGEIAVEPWRAEPAAAGHGRAVDACRERIAAGDLYQANLSLRLRSRLRGRAADLFTRAQGDLAPDRAAFLAGDWGAIASLSPELFLERHGDRVRSAPIKGTRRREGPDGDAAARDELAASVKDRAENVMIVDLVRNDLGRVCAPGTIEVRSLAEPRPHAGVWHLVSEVEGTLAPGRDDADLLQAAFPPGSVTGAPKLAAIAVIHEIESAARQIFTGAIGFASPGAGLELSVAIRTFEIRGDEIWLDVGGGIVADSDAAAETEEALVKARPLLDAIGGVLADPAPAGRAPAPARLGPRPVPRPDPAAGVFETLLVRDGAPVALEAHLARLAASCEALGFGSIPADTAARAVALAAKERSARLRITVVPGEGVAGELAPLPDRAEPLVLEPVTVPGGIGAHKWNDRRLIDALSAHVAPAVPLLVDLDGYVLEAAWANVLILDADGVLCTPPQDGRILPGVTRAQALAEARTAGGGVVERPIHLDELDTAAEILLSSALAGLVAGGLAS
jgi:para-aminobenzoate synthetase/4-amino-4-deoxychorismate lyase